MRKLLSIFLIFIFFGVVNSGESSIPKIKDGSYDIEFRKGKTYFVDFTYEIKVQGVAKSYNAWLQVILYNEKGEELESFGQRIKIESKKLQTFYGRKMITMVRAKEIKQVGFDLGIYQKKY